MKNATFILGGKFFFLNATFHVILVRKDFHNYKHLFSEVGPENEL